MLDLVSGTETADAYTPGPGSGQGTINITVGTASTINFTNLAPVLDTVPGPLTVNGTAASNAINYSVGAQSTNNGLVTVDGFESTEFSNKTVLTIASGAGNDTINLNNPNTPTGLTSIVVNGGNPIANSDVVTLNGLATADTINYSVTTATAATVTGAGPVPVTIASASAVVINGQGGGDALTFTSPAGSNSDTFTPGANPDSGSISAQSAGGVALLPMSFSNLGSASGSLTFNNAGGRTDTLSITDTLASDTIALASTTGQIKLAHTVPINTTGIANLNLFGQGGADVFNVAGTQPYGNVLLSGGSSTDDTVNLSARIPR